MQLSAPTFPTEPAANFPFDGAVPNSKSAHSDGRDSAPADFGRMLSSKSDAERERSPRAPTAARDDSPVNTPTSNHHRHRAHKHTAVRNEADGESPQNSKSTADPSALLAMLPVSVQPAAPSMPPTLFVPGESVAPEPISTLPTSLANGETVVSSDATTLVTNNKARRVLSAPTQAHGRGPVPSSEEKRADALSAAGAPSPVAAVVDAAKGGETKPAAANETLTSSAAEPEIAAVGADNAITAVRLPASGATITNAKAILSSAASPSVTALPDAQPKLEVKLDSAPESSPAPIIAAEAPDSPSPPTKPLTPDLAPSPEPHAGLEEKIAAALAPSSERAASTDKISLKPSLESGNKRVEASYGHLGINAAKPETLMSSPALATLPITPVVETTSFDATPLAFDAWSKDGSDAAPLVEHSSREAVESVIVASETLTSGVQRSVKLQFSVGGEDLAVRVELRGDRVHTTFRTDSPELRSALAREWQAVSGQQTGDRGQRLADPVFASSSSSGSNHSFSTDSGAAHQRDPESRQAREAAAEAGAFRRALRAKPAVASASVVTSPVLVPASSRRLQTFA